MANTSIQWAGEHQLGVLERFRKLIKARGDSFSHLARRAIEEYLAREEKKS